MGPVQASASDPGALLRQTVRLAPHLQYLYLHELTLGQN
jgi:hypothetical protein